MNNELDFLNDQKKYVEKICHIALVTDKMYMILY